MVAPAPIPAGVDVWRIMSGGFAEGLIPGMVGFTVLAVSWTLVAVGFKRQT
jgi:hypothetical protein